MIWAVVMLLDVRGRAAPWSLGDGMVEYEPGAAQGLRDHLAAPVSPSSPPGRPLRPDGWRVAEPVDQGGGVNTVLRESSRAAGGP
ncbi:hypothetical protein [Streptomyces sp. URMC 123]|uniref:hypothetical protein n=1 Tax=Streptomyces sp. URMC 123 TaxID=3423403 RepID=UPI003F1D4789